MQVVEHPPVSVVADHTHGSDKIARLGRVLHLINGQHYAGAERVQDLLAARLPALGYEVGFCCLKPDRFPEQRHSRGTPLFELPMRHRWDLGSVRNIARLVRDHHYTLLHSHTPRAALIGRLVSVLTGVPLVHHIHSPTARDSTARFRNQLNSVAERVSVTRIAGAIAVSNSMGHYARQLGVPARRLAVVHNGVPTRGMLPIRSTPRGTWTIGTVALFRPRKGLEVLLDSLARLRREGHDVCLRAVGTFETADYQAQILARAARLGISGSIDWRGFCCNVPTEMEQMDLFVLPSLFGEGLPMVVLEAMSAGVPVVGTRVEGVPEAIRDGQEGLIATPGDSLDLARAMARVLNGDIDWQALRSRAHARQAAAFSDHSMAAGVAAFYQRIPGR